MLGWRGGLIVLVELEIGARWWLGRSGEGRLGGKGIVILTEFGARSDGMMVVDAALGGRRGGQTC